MKKIAIIGANNQQNPLIVRAKEKGLESHVFAWQTGTDLGERSADFFYPISAGNKDEILEKCKEIGIDAVISIGSDIAAISAAYVAGELSLPSNGYSAVVCATNKLLTRTLFERCGIPQPEFLEIADAIPQRISSLGFPLLVKPSDRSGGRGLKKVENEPQLMRAINEARDVSFERKAIAEKYIEGQLYSCECISYDGKHTLLGYTKRYDMSLGGKICEYMHECPAVIPRSVTGELERLVPRVLDTLGIRCGASSVEFILDKDKRIYIIEVTPTMYGDYIGTDLLPTATGYDYLGMVLDIALGNAPDLTIMGNKKQASVRFIYSSDDPGAPVGMDIPSVPDGVRYAHVISVSEPKQYGGCPPVSLGAAMPGHLDGYPKLALNSEYTAFYCALTAIKPKRINIPYYLSGAFERIVKELDIEPVYYRIGADMAPIDIAEGDAATLIINHSPACTVFINEFVKSHTGVIIDNSYAYFEEPVIAEGVYNLYSPRKFFAVPDGGYLIAESLPEIDLPTDVSYKRCRNLLRSLEEGEGAAYKEYTAAEQELVGERRRMSALTEKMLRAVDEDREREARKSNFTLLHRMLGKVNSCSLDFESCAVRKFYPLLVNEDVRSQLIENKIYTPTMYRRLISDSHRGTYERLFSEKMLYLPIDAWYSPEDMEYIASLILSLIS